MVYNRNRVLALILAVMGLTAMLVFPAYATWYNVGTSSYDVFRKQTIGKEFDTDDAYGVQCVDGASVLWQQFGRTLDTGGTHMARGCWQVKSARTANAGKEFDLVTKFENVLRGDVIVMWNGNESSAGHICFADENYNGTVKMNIYGQNQNGVKKFNVFSHGSVGKQFLGAFRLKKWKPTYALVVNAKTGGTLVSTLKEAYQEGATVKVAVKADEDYVFGKWTSDQITFADPYSASTSFVMPAKKSWANAWFAFCKTLTTEAGQRRVCEPVADADGFTDEQVSRHIPSATGIVINQYKTGDIVDIVGTVENANGTVWYKLKDDSYIYFGCLYSGCVNHTPVIDPAIEPTCTEAGKTEGSHCSVCNAVLVAQEVVPALGHNWGEPSYEWTTDYSTVTAKRVCSHDSSHMETETVNTTSVVSLQPTTTQMGQTTYTATFTNSAFVTQTKTVENIPVVTPTTAPTSVPTTAPTSAPTAAPTSAPTATPTSAPTTAPTSEPAVKISKCEITVKDVTYNGKAVTAKAMKNAVIVSYNGNKLKYGTDYTLAYSKKLKAIGPAKVTVKGKGKYEGSKKLKFNIVPRGTTFSKLTGDKQKITLKWKNQKNINGYEIQYSLKKDFSGSKTVKIKKAKTLTTTIKKLKANKTYYVRIRTYTTVKKKNYYSVWSTAKTVKTKSTAVQNEFVDTTEEIDLADPDLNMALPQTDDVPDAGITQDIEIELSEE